MISITIWVFFAVSLVAYYFLRPRKREINLPGPWALPLVGNMLQMETSFYKTLVKWSKKYGPLCKFKIANKTIVLVGDHNYAKEMLSTDAFVGRAYVDEFTLFEGENIGLINSEGHVWEQQRRFVVRQLRDFGFAKSSMESVILEEVSDLQNRMASLNGKPVEDVKNEMALAVFNSLWCIVAGTRYSQNDPRLRNLAKQLSGAFDEAAEKGGLIAFCPWMKHFVPEFSGYNAIRRLMANIVKFVGETVQSHKETLEEESPRDFIDVYLNEIKKTSDPASSFYGTAAEKQLIGVVADLFQAGADATAQTLSWGILYLLKLKDIQEKMRDEVKAVTGNTRPVSLSDRSKMPYAQAFVSELLRKANAPFGVPHRVLFDAEFKGVFFPKDTAIFFNLQYIHNDPKLWGDPENFRPERFLSADEKTFKKIEYLNPFLAGRRQCPGETLARDATFLFATNLVQRFDILADPNSSEPDLEPAVSFMIKHKPYKVVFIERKD